MIHCTKHRLKNKGWGRGGGAHCCYMYVYIWKMYILIRFLIDISLSNRCQAVVIKEPIINIYKLTSETEVKNWIKIKKMEIKPETIGEKAHYLREIKNYLSISPKTSIFCQYCTRNSQIKKINSINLCAMKSPKRLENANIPEAFHNAVKWNVKTC